MEFETLNAWLWIRAAKFFSLFCYAIGLVGVSISPERRTRLNRLYGFGLPGFILTYSSGWLLMRMSGASLLTPWLLLGVILGAFALHVAFLLSYLEHPRPVTAPLLWSCFGAALALMTLRVEGVLDLFVVGTIGAVLGAMMALSWSRVHLTCTDDDQAVMWKGLLWVTRLEGASLLFMLFVSIPTKLIFGVRIDGGTGLIGWVHGLLVILFVQSLASTCKALRWPRKELAVGVLSSLVPGGSLWFEARIKRNYLR